ncbi:hypothetical protein VRU48_14595 [Pedobacter sp. KR3-3]|uniref:Lipoprotein n=1 Tax=Pedobacter albus TaxID=3113905 RepID=A0ABU7IA59_9SPHI|nr:hypothetical protein [Pedobacter sp. KR3-3]MEE1946351.1 hypothetical protein [Pedobacter sp. KR3-3]
MKNKITTIFFLLFLSITGCKNVYYVGLTDTSSALFSSEDTLYHDKESMTVIPAREKILIKKKIRKGLYQVAYRNNSGYIFNPRFSYYRKFNSQIDGNLYGYSTIKPATSTQKETYSGGDVSVKGYYRKNGTYVRPHTRSAPSRRH